MLPKRLFPGWKRIGKTEVCLTIAPDVKVSELLDWYDPFSWAKGARIARKSDVTIIQWWTSSIAHIYLAIITLSGRKTHFVMEFHEVVDPLEYAILPLQLYAKFMGRIIRGAASMFIVHSEHDRHLIASQYNIQPSKISVIPHGLYDHYPVLDRKSSKRKMDADGKFVILFFGLLRPYKGVTTLIEAFEKSDRNIQDNSVLIIAGEAWEDKESVIRIEQSPLRDKIVMVNRYIADEDVPEFFSAADILVLPYTRASQSGVAHIGIAYGLPIIASKVGGLIESLGSYMGTCFIEASDVNGLVKALKDQYEKKNSLRYDPPSEMRWEQVAERFYDEII